MKNAVILIAEGFEEIEAVTIIDTLRRGEVDIISLSVTGNLTVTGAHGIPITCDALFDKNIAFDRDILILPGGMPGTANLSESKDVIETIKYFYNHDKNIAAICAAPMILGKMGLLKGLKATIYPGMEEFLRGAIRNSSSITEFDGNMLTGKGPALALDFALELLEIAAGENTAYHVSTGMLKPRARIR